MERLTRKSEKSDYTTMGFIYMDKDTDCYKAVQRLADYEDIGTVDDFKDLKAGAENLNLKGDEILLKPFEVKGFVHDSEEYKQLKAEKESLKKQLENSVLLPCKVGCVIYWVTKGNDFECREFYYIEEGRVEWVMVEDDGTYWIYVKYNSGLTYQHHIEKTTQEDNLYQYLSEAEARLKELQKQS